MTTQVRQAYEKLMAGCQEQGIIRRNGFLYLDGEAEIHFRRKGALERDIAQIAPEELADGLYQIIQQNVTVEREGLYRALGAQCGQTRLGRADIAALERALNLLADKIQIDGSEISLK